MNLSLETIEVGVGQVIAILDEATGITSEIGQEETAAAIDGPDPAAGLPEHLEELYTRSTASMQDDYDKELVRDLLIKFSDVFVGPTEKLGRSTAGTHSFFHCI